MAKEHDRHVVLCHVLRYSPFYLRIKELIDSGKIGKVVTINAVEGVGYFHQAHSFVRGNWRDTAVSSPMILAKCCHDVDILLWLANSQLKSVSSFGGLYYFKSENAPAGATDYCFGGCRAKDDCPYDAVDHQVVNFEFADGATAHLLMTTFTAEINRTIQVCGTLGMSEGGMHKNTLKTTLYGHPEQTDDLSQSIDGHIGHGGGDRMMDALYMLLTGEADSARTEIEDSIASHLACFAAECSRLNNGIPEKL